MRIRVFYKYFSLKAQALNYQLLSPFFKALIALKMTFRFFSEIESPWAPLSKEKNRTSKNEWFSIYKPSKLRFLVILVR